MKKLKKLKPIKIDNGGIHSLKTTIEFCYGQYLRFERNDGAYIGALDPTCKYGRRDVKRLKKWCTKMLRDSK